MASKSTFSPPISNASTDNDAATRDGSAAAADLAISPKPTDAILLIVSSVNSKA